MPTSIDVGVGPGAPRHRPDIQWMAGFGGNVPGALTVLPAGLLLTRASSAAVRTGAATVSAPIAVDVARVGSSGGGSTGLEIDGAATNLLVRSAELATSPWQVAAIGVTNPVRTADQAVAPDGTTSAEKFDYPAISTLGHATLFYQQRTLTIGAVYEETFWLRGAVGGEQVYVMYTSLGVAFDKVACALTTEWQRFAVRFTCTHATENYIQVGIDRRDVTQAGHAAQTVYAWGAQAELSPATSYVATAGAAATRAGERLYHPTGVASLGSGNALSIEMRFRPLVIPAEYGATGGTYPFLWATSGGQFAYVFTPTRQIAVNDGVTEVAFTPALAWAAGDVVDLWIAAYGGAGAGKYRVNDGAATDLGALASLANFAGTSLDLFCSGTAHQLSSRIEHVRAYRAGKRPKWAV